MADQEVRVGDVVVLKHTAMIHMSNVLTKTQRQFSNILLKEAFDKLPLEEKHQVPLKVIQEKLPYESKNIENIREMLSVLNKTQMTWNIFEKDRKNKVWGVSTILAYAKVSQGNVEYGYSPGMRELLGNPNIYGRIDLEVQKGFRGKHALAIWEFLVECLCSDQRGQKGVTEWIKISDLKRLLGLDKEKSYNTFKVFNYSILRPSVKEINEVSDISVQMEFKREKRKISHVRYLVERKHGYQLAMDFGDEYRSDFLVEGNKDLAHLLDRLEAKGINGETGKQLLNIFGKDQILENLKYVDKQVGNKVNIRSLSGYTIRAIRENYRVSDSDQEEARPIHFSQKSESDKIDSWFEIFSSQRKEAQEALWDGKNQKQRKLAKQLFEETQKENMMFNQSIKPKGMRSLLYRNMFLAYLGSQELDPKIWLFPAWVKRNNHVDIEKIGSNYQLVQE